MLNVHIYVAERTHEGKKLTNNSILVSSCTHAARLFSLDATGIFMFVTAQGNFTIGPQV